DDVSAAARPKSDQHTNWFIIRPLGKGGRSGNDRQPDNQCRDNEIAFHAAPRAQPFSSSIGLRSTPIPSISISHVSTAFIHGGSGLRAWPTPDGVPVRMTSPGSNVIPLVR